MTGKTGTKLSRIKTPIIIAMKGHPGTGKSTLANSLASFLHIPLIDKDDVRNATAPLQHTLSSLTSPITSSTLLNDLSYAAIWHIASTQLRLGLSLIIDSPLSRKTHFERLLQLADSAGARLLIVECKPGDVAAWRERLERRNDSWHKPSAWEDMERLLEGYAGCTEYDVGDIPKLVVDTTAVRGGGVEEVVEFIDAALGHSGDDRDADGYGQVAKG